MENKLAEVRDRIDALARAGRLKEAQPLLFEAAELTRRACGEESPEFAAALNDLGGAYRALGGFEDAEKTFVLAAGILERTVGKRSPDYATTINNLAGLYRLMGRQDKAEQVILEAIEIYHQTLGTQLHRSQTWAWPTKSWAAWREPENVLERRLKSTSSFLESPASSTGV